MPHPATDGGPAFLETVWYGGCRNAEMNFAGRVLAPSDSSAAFLHEVRARRLPSGEPEVWFLEDSYPKDLDGRWVNVTIPSPKWHRLLHPQIAAALLTRAEAEARVSLSDWIP